MIKFIDINQEKPYLNFKNKYELALEKGQKNIEALSISSYNPEKKEVDSRFVNLKFINDKNFIFFSNYNSPKSKAFESHNQIAALIYWPSINVQIRMKAIIKKTTREFNNEYFKTRSPDKNSLAISSDQSQKISSYDEVVERYNIVQKSKDLTKCPEAWGGFSFTPHYFEFWEGHQSRLNKRKVFIKRDNFWENFIIQP